MTTLRRRLGIVGGLGGGRTLRCVVFHDIAESESVFTRGMDVTETPSHFERALRFITKHYHPVALRDVLDGHPLPDRPALVTFDDGYASIMETAIPLCKRLGIPATLFLNAAFVDNKRLSPDNLVCYVANVFGMRIINLAARSVCGEHYAPAMRETMDVFRRLFTSTKLPQRAEFLQTLIKLAEIDDGRIALERRLYLTGAQVRALSRAGFEIGNHTMSHVHCRHLCPGDLPNEIDRNKKELEMVSTTNVRCFSVPYGSSVDLSNELVDHLRRSGHERIFLSEGLRNSCRDIGLFIDRVGLSGGSDNAMLLELEVLPNLRRIRNRLARPKDRRSQLIRESMLRHGDASAWRGDGLV